MKNNSRKLKQIIPLLLSITFFALSCAAFLLLYKHTLNNNKIFREAEVQWEKETLEKKKLGSLDQLLEMTEEERLFLDIHYIKSSDIVPFLDSIEKLAPQANTKAEVTLVNISPDNTSLSVGVTAQGTFENLYKFLTLLENSPYQLEITSMDIKRVTEGEMPTKGAPAEWLVTFKIKLLSFVK